MEKVKKKKPDKPWLNDLNNFYEGEDAYKTESSAVTKNDSVSTDVDSNVENVEPSKSLTKEVQKESVSHNAEIKVVEEKGEYKNILIQLDVESAYKASIYALLNHVSRRVWIQNIILEKLAQLEPININAKGNEKE